MKKALLLSLLLVVAVATWLAWPTTQDSTPNIQYPKPTNGTTQVKYGEEGEERHKREAWIANMHRAEEGVSWQQIEYLNQMTKHRQRVNSGLARSGCDLMEVAGGALKGTWHERGSINQAGSVFDTEYDPVTDEVWVISAGGTLFKGDRLGQTWEVINQDFTFSHGLLQFIPMPDGGRRLLAGINGVPHYSDDDGLSWNAASGITVTDSWGGFHTPVVLDDGSNKVYLLSKPSYWTNISLYQSDDNGESYTLVQLFTSNFFSDYMLCKPHQTNDVYLMRKLEDDTGQIFKINTDNDQLIWINQDVPLHFSDTRANLIGAKTADGVRFYCYAADLQVFQSDDLTQEWTPKGMLPTNPWSVGMYVLPSDPEALFYGEVELYRSLDGGDEWEKINNWWEYYDFVETKIHADIMHMAEFEMEDGTPFFLVSNHGGIQYSDDKMVNQLNIGLSDLNVSQYYSVRTDPLDPTYVYAGSQDQGFQRAALFEEGGVDDIEWFDQVISGDYGHIVFSKNGEALWTVYPGGWVIHYDDPRSAYHVASYEVNSDHESVWLPPLMSSPNAEEDVIYMAGGSINGGEGSHMIRLEKETWGISATQGDFDFKAESGGELSALETSPMNANKFYAATTSGRFFYSNNSGDTWEQTSIFLPGGHYLYGQTILASKNEENTVYLGGSGYSNPPVYRSNGWWRDLYEYE
jgi:hypothetical protein